MTDDRSDRRARLGAATVATAAAFGAPAEAAGASRLTVRILDLHGGVPADGVAVDLARREGEAFRPVKTVTTRASGRPDGPLLEGGAFTAGRYRLAFDLITSFTARDPNLPKGFFRKVALEFGVADPGQPHHLPPQCTPWTQACSVLPG